MHYASGFFFFPKIPNVVQAFRVSFGFHYSMYGFRYVQVFLSLLSMYQIFYYGGSANDITTSKNIYTTNARRSVIFILTILTLNVCCFSYMMRSSDANYINPPYPMVGSSLEFDKRTRRAYKGLSRITCTSCTVRINVGVVKIYELYHCLNTYNERLSLYRRAIAALGLSE